MICGPWARGMPALWRLLHLGLVDGGYLCTDGCAASELRQLCGPCFAMLRLGRGGRERLEGVSFGQWLDEHKQPASLVTKFYDPILISALNEETRRGSAKYAIQVFQEAMLANSRGYVVGLPACPLGELYAKLPAGVDVRLNARVEEVVFEMRNAECGMENEKRETRNAKRETYAVGVKIRGGATGVGEILRADAVVLATNHHAVQRWVAALSAEVVAADGRFAHLDNDWRACRSLARICGLTGR